MDIEATSTLLAAIMGALIAGGVSWFLQARALKAATAEHQQDRLEIRKAAGYSLFFKLIRLHSDLVNLGRPVRERIDAAKKDGFDGTPFQVVPPVVPLPGPIRFSSEEMALVLSLDSNLFNDIAPLDDLHSNTVALFELYNSKRSDAVKGWGASVEGHIGTSDLTDEQFRRLQPRAVELNDLINGMLERTEHDAPQAREAIERWHAVLVREFNLKHKLSFKGEPLPKV